MLTKQSKIAIVGCGGLGSNVASNLVRAGFTNLLIIDFDVVNESNLNRQFYFQDQIGKRKTDAIKENLSRISDKVKIQCLFEKINEINISDCLSDAVAVLECVDNASAKSLIVQYALNQGKIIIAASGVCETCVEYPIKVEKKFDEFYLIGDGITDIANGNQPFSAKISAIAAYQADILISLLRNCDINKLPQKMHCL
jgi:sulfur carrier protein ThiS adenylyltransferase